MKNRSAGEGTRKNSTAERKKLAAERKPVNVKPRLAVMNIRKENESDVNNIRSI